MSVSSLPRSIEDLRYGAPARSTDVHALLEAAGLPASDLRDGRTVWLEAAYRGDRMVGAVGLECMGSIGLLRSLVVVPEERRSGIGRNLVELAEAHARERGVHTLYLLTTTAAPFFRRSGYAVADRTSAPAAIRASSEFARLCPASAVFMVKGLSAQGARPGDATSA